MASTAQRGYGGQHQRDAKTCIEAQPWCTWCGATDDLVADHLEPGNPAAGYQTLCRRHNTIRRHRMRGKTKRPTLTVMCGIPASGKTTWAVRTCGSSTLILSTDAIRTANVHATLVFADLEAQATAELVAGRDVVIDACSTQDHRRRRWLALARSTAAATRLVIVPVRLDAAIARQRQRPRHERISVAQMNNYAVAFHATVHAAPSEGWDSIEVIT